MVGEGSPVRLVMAQQARGLTEDEQKLRREAQAESMRPAKCSDYWSAKGMANVGIYPLCLKHYAIEQIKRQPFF